MTKQEMIEVLKQNDQDKSINVYSPARKRITDYRDNEEKNEKARECSKRWRKNNPEKARENWGKLVIEYILFPLENDKLDEVLEKYFLQSKKKHSFFSHIKNGIKKSSINQKP